VRPGAADGFHQGGGQVINKIRFGGWLAAAALAFAALAAPGWAADSSDAKRQQLEETLQQFCTKWMGFLADREADNKKAIAWHAIAEGVEGEFVGYGKDYSCGLSDYGPHTKVPVATIKYLELKYQHKGASSSAAMGSTPKVVEATEVTEIFRFSQNKWVY
jgi:hypothetical protein